MSLKKLIAISYITTGAVIVLLIAIGVYAKTTGKGTPKSASKPTPASTTQNNQTSTNQTSDGTSSTSPAPTSAASSPSSSVTPAKTTAPATTSTPSPTPKPSPTPTPTPTPPPPAPCGGQSPCYSATTVASHNSSGNCWVIVGSTVYGVTAYVTQHPGGQSVFNASTCGHDITSYLNGSASTAGQRHGHSGSAYTILNSYKVGYLQ